MQDKETNQGNRKRTRLSPQQREKEIVEGAILYFADVGFAGNMRDLAARLGISHSLLFRYFPTKEALIDRVYQQVFLRRWNADWDFLLNDRRVPIEARLVRFYKEYLNAIYRPEWVRTFIYAGLNGEKFNQRYLKLIKRKVIVPIALELKLLSGVIEDNDATPSKMELELSWGLHGEVYYLAIRRWVYGMKVTSDLDGFVEFTVAKFLHGAPAALKRALKDQ